MQVAPAPVEPAAVAQNLSAASVPGYRAAPLAADEEAPQQAEDDSVVVSEHTYPGDGLWESRAC
ncbi:hypothetical protein [Streptomyces collinus]|uniref:hypothetical protein n=1 Tax=Streptomyces collinus TaxID=42684 RepID=UPI003410005C